MITLSYFWVLSPFVIFDCDYALILCPLFKSNTLWNIFMVLSRNVEQDEMTFLYKNENSGFLTFGGISLCFVSEIDFMSTL